MGDLIVITILPNSYGWFEGYNLNDRNKLCGVSHINGIKKLNFHSKSNNINI